MFFFFNDTATTEIYTLSLHDALPISRQQPLELDRVDQRRIAGDEHDAVEALVDRVVDPNLGRLRLARLASVRSEEHTSELQSRQYLVCRLLLEKKKKINTSTPEYEIL